MYFSIFGLPLSNDTYSISYKTRDEAPKSLQCVMGIEAITLIDHRINWSKNDQMGFTKNTYCYIHKWIKTENKTLALVFRFSVEACVGMIGKLQLVRIESWHALQRSGGTKPCDGLKSWLIDSCSDRPGRLAMRNVRIPEPSIEFDLGKWC